MWKSFPFSESISDIQLPVSVYEARLAYEEFGSKAHTYSPAYTETDFPVIMKCSSHITFNSFNQFRHFYPEIEANEEKISCGIRINPEYSEVEVELITLVLPVPASELLPICCPIHCLPVLRDFIAIAIVNPVLMSWSIH